MAMARDNDDDVACVTHLVGKCFLISGILQLKQPKIVYTKNVLENEDR